MARYAVRQQMVRQAWAAAVGGRFSEAALLESAVGLATTAERRAVLRQALPLAWAKLDLAPLDEWYAATGLPGEAFDAIDHALEKGLPEGNRERLHAYALSPGEFPALLFLALVVSRLPGRIYDPAGPHAAVRATLWHVPELIVAIMRTLPPKFDLGALPEMLTLLLPERRRIEHMVGVIALPEEDCEAPAEPYAGRPRPPPPPPPVIGEAPPAYDEK
jgi:hypothetical protein